MEKEKTLIHESQLIENKNKRTPKSIKKGFYLYVSEKKNNLLPKDYVNKDNLIKSLKNSFEQECKCKIGMFSATKIINNLLFD